jgi:type 1 fimbria pilin
MSDGETAGATGCTIEGGDNIGVDDGSLYIGVREAGESRRE